MQPNWKAMHSKSRGWSKHTAKSLVSWNHL